MRPNRTSISSLALIIALALAPAIAAQGFLRPPRAVPEVDPWVGTWHGTAEETDANGAAVSYPVHFVVAKQDSRYTARAEAELMLRDDSNRPVTVRYRGEFDGTLDAGSLQLTSRRLEMEIVETGQRIPVSTQRIVASLEQGAFVGRAGNDDEGWASFRCQKENAAPVPAPGPGPSPMPGPFPGPGPSTTAASLAPPIDPMFALVPGADGLRAPENIRPGTRMTFWLGTANTVGAAGRSTVHEDPNGPFRDENGRSLRLDEVPTGGAAAGYQEIDVIAVTDTAVVMDVRHYDGDGTVQPPSPGSVTSLVCHPSGCEYWVHPHVLAHLPTGERDGLNIVRGQYQHNGRTFRAVMIQVKSSSSSSANVYDLDTGLQISFSATMRSSATRNEFDPSTGRYGPATSTDSTIVVSQWVHVRALNLPWAQTPLPTTFDGRTLRYQGAQTLDMGVAPPSSTPFQASITIHAIGGGLTRQELVANLGGNVVRLESYSSPAQFGALIVAPAALATLRPGQEIDYDPVTHDRTVVEHIGPDVSGVAVVVIASRGRGGLRRWVYDARSGVLLEGLTQQQFGQPVITTGLSIRLLSS
ncbi:MAG: hypothetical protein KDC38_08770 [Planctomycetes bacterium]|nr:hypothetical protein [Planctomycetota bacterium]